MRIHIIYFKFILFVILITSCENSKPNFSNHDFRYYYCSVFENAGLDHKLLNPIYNLNDFNQKKSQLMKLFPHKDATYYKVEQKNKKIISYGYSMKTNKLEEIIKSDESGKEIFAEYFTNGHSIKKCSYKYKFFDTNLTRYISCTDKTLRIEYYKKKYEMFYWTKTILYKNNILQQKYFRNENDNVIAKSDMCVPYYVGIR